MPMHLENIAFIIRKKRGEREKEERRKLVKRRYPLHTHLQHFARTEYLGNVY